MTEETSRIQYDPEVPGPVISALTTASALVRISEVIQHVIEVHEVDDAGAGDLAHLTLTVSQMAADLAVFILKHTEGEDDPEGLASLLANGAPSDEELWESLNGVMSEDEIAAIQREARGESGE